MNYQEFLASKAQFFESTGFIPHSINPLLFPFQKAIVKWALQRGKAGIFADTGLGKTAMQVEFADQVCKHTNGNVLILAPLCVSQQTVIEAAKFGIPINYCRQQSQAKPGITITNYEMIDHFDMAEFIGIILDESSILKSQSGKIRSQIIASCRNVPYKLSCTATPSPNDYMELGNQAEFLGIMSATEMLAMFFTHDGGDTSSWRLKGHGKTKFWEWLASWSVCIKNPSDIGFPGDDFTLPPLLFNEHVVDVEYRPEDDLFSKVAVTLTERRDAKRHSMGHRVELASDLVNNSTEQWLIWCHLNAESSAVAKSIPDSSEIVGSDSLEHKERTMMGFINGDVRVLVTKPSIAGYGMNLQNCHNVVFLGLDDSYESFYQAVRRCWRYGQKSTVNVHILTSPGEGAVKKNIERKQKAANTMTNSMIEHMSKFSTANVLALRQDKTEYKEGLNHGQAWSLRLGDCVEQLRHIKDDSIGYSIFSPPFASLYTYSNSDRDMGNCRSYGEFYDHFKFLIGELYRVLLPGRLCSFHCMNLQTSKQNHGVIGLHDFRGELIRLFTDAGWIYHSEVCIWKDPVMAMHRTKALGLLYKQLKKDSCMSRQGIPDYLVTMRKPGENVEPVTKHPDSFPVGLWQRYASPIWMDINPSDTLQFRTARENDDERHIAPLQLQVIQRGIELWSNPGDIVLSPFAGIGSEGYMAIKLNRRFIGIELKESYYKLAIRNLQNAEKEQYDLLSGVTDDDDSILAESA